VDIVSSNYKESDSGLPEIRVHTVRLYMAETGIQKFLWNSKFILSFVYRLFYNIYSRDFNIEFSSQLPIDLEQNFKVKQPLQSFYLTLP